MVGQGQLPQGEVAQANTQRGRAGRRAQAGPVPARAPVPHRGWPVRAAALSVCVTMGLGSPGAAEAAPQAAPKPAPQAAPAVAPAAVPWAQPFAPALGRQWRIVSESRSTTKTNDAEIQYLLTASYDLVYTAREGTGYRVRMVLREVTVDSLLPAAQAVMAALEVIRDVPVVGITDAAGLPLTVENATEVRTATAAMSGRVLAHYADKPHLLPILRQTLAAVQDISDAAATTTWLAPLTLLASAQNTPLRPEEDTRKADSMPNPFGGRLRGETVTRLAPGSRPGHLTLLSSNTPEPAALREMTLGMLRRIAAAQPGGGGLNEQKAKLLLSQMRMEVSTDTQIEVEGGMARHARATSASRVSIPGLTMDIAQIQVLTLTPAP